MVNKRIELQYRLEEILGSKNVYFQPPSSVKMSYPSIVYKLSSISNKHANNGVYLQDFFYEIIVIEKKADSEIVEKISKIDKIAFSSRYVTENLYHTVFKLYL